jgi:hypothetical protein
MFDSDGTVGKIEFEKNGCFRDQEIKQLLESASAVSWQGIPSSPRECSGEEVKEGETEPISNEPTQWVGEHTGAIIFDAEEVFDPMDFGHDYLAVMTRQLY